MSYKIVILIKSFFCVYSAPLYLIPHCINRFRYFFPFAPPKLGLPLAPFLNYDQLRLCVCDTECHFTFCNIRSLLTKYYMKRACTYTVRRKVPFVSTGYLLKFLYSSFFLFFFSSMECVLHSIGITHSQKIKSITTIKIKISSKIAIACAFLFHKKFWDIRRDEVLPRLW